MIVRSLLVLFVRFLHLDLHAGSSGPNQNRLSILFAGLDCQVVIIDPHIDLRIRRIDQQQRAVVTLFHRRQLHIGIFIPLTVESTEPMLLAILYGNDSQADEGKQPKQEDDEHGFAERLARSDQTHQHIDQQQDRNQYDQDTQYLRPDAQVGG